MISLHSIYFMVEKRSSATMKHEFFEETQLQTSKLNPKFYILGSKCIHLRAKLGAVSVSKFWDCMVLSYIGKSPGAFLCKTLQRTCLFPPRKLGKCY